MNPMRTLLVIPVAAALLACATEDPLLNSHDASSDVASGVGGSGGTPTVGTGGSVGQGGSGGVATGGTTTKGAGGTAVGAGGTMARGTGGAAGGRNGGSTGAGGTASTGGSTGKDAGVADTARDAPAQRDGVDAAVECAPGYPVGSSRPAGDGCNTCVCQATGVFLCTTTPCPVADASPDVCPAGQRWCPGCTPGTGSCGAVCTGAPCLVPDAGPSDARTDVGSGDGGPACATLTTQTDCQARSDCHAVFTDPGTCGCAAAGCCARFSRCADGGKAVCTPPAGLACTIATPFCESPYVLSYTAVCYEGCVLNTECGP